MEDIAFKIYQSSKSIHVYDLIKMSRFFGDQLRGVNWKLSGFPLTLAEPGITNFHPLFSPSVPFISSVPRQGTRAQRVEKQREHCSLDRLQSRFNPESGSVRCLDSSKIRWRNYPISYSRFGNIESVSWWRIFREMATSEFRTFGD